MQCSGLEHGCVQDWEQNCEASAVQLAAELKLRKAAEERLAGAQQTRQEAEAALVDMREKKNEVEEALADTQKKSSETDQALTDMEKKKTDAEVVLAGMKKKSIEAEQTLTDMQNAAEKALADAKQAHQQTMKVTALPCHQQSPVSSTYIWRSQLLRTCRVNEQLSKVKKLITILNTLLGAKFCTTKSFSNSYGLLLAPPSHVAKLATCHNAVPKHAAVSLHVTGRC